MFGRKNENVSEDDKAVPENLNVPTNEPLTRSTNDDGVEEKIPLSVNRVNRDDSLARIQENRWNEMSNEEELTLINQDRRDKFKKLVDDIYAIDAPGYLDLLDLQPYKSHKLVIYQGLQRLGKENQKHAVMVAAVIFSLENALHVANAIRTLINSDVLFYNTNFMQAAHLSLVDTGKDAGTIASSIFTYNLQYQLNNSHRFNSANAHTYINLLIRLRQAGIMLTENICLVIAKASESNWQQVIESFISLKVAGILTDDLCLILDLYEQYQYSTEIADLLILLNKKIPLTNEIITLAIMNGSLASKIIKEIELLIEPSIDDIKTIFNMSYQSDVATSNLSVLLDKAQSSSKIQAVEESLSALENAGIPTEHYQLILALSENFERLNTITDLLIKSKNEFHIPLTNDVIDLVVHHPGLLAMVANGIRKLMDHGIKPSIELIIALCKIENNINNTIDGLLLLYSKNMLPQVMFTGESEMKLPVLTPRSVINIISCKYSAEALEGCKLLAQHRDEIELIDDLIVECMLSRSPEEMREILQAYLSLKRENKLLDDNDIEDICFAVLCGTGIQAIEKRIFKYIAKEKLLPFPSVLSDCIYSYFKSPYSSARRPACKVEQIEDDVAESKIEAPKFTAKGS